ncbi:MAG: hypothetical protein KatS3mg081_2093 [Gemmatimonadales bacterium]|nr:MAG: hypothetical protein KatS3mg081_2093 [Gemmatimonadales bacterium]
MGLIYLTLLLLIVNAWACREEPRSGGADSSLESYLEGRGAPRLEVTRVLELAAGGPGDPEILKVADATRLANGAFVVADEFKPGLLFFDSLGRFVRAVGRQGRGPGEFEHIAGLVRCSRDSVFVWDNGVQRIAVFDSTGAAVREFAIRGSPYIVACSPSGVLAVLEQPRIIERMDPEGRSLRRYTGELWLGDATGRRALSVGTFDLGENRPLGRLTHLAVARDRIYVGTAESLVVQAYGMDGSNQSEIEILAPMRRPSDADYERAIELLVEGFTERDYREQMKQELLKIPKPEWLPFYREIFSDPDGFLWVVVSGPGEPVTILEGFTRAGEIGGYVVLPARSRVLEVGVDYFLVLESREEKTAVVLYRYGIAS